MRQIFISYSRKDQSKVDFTCQLLEQHGFSNIWIDRNAIRGGSKWREEIVNGIRDSDYFIIFISSHSIQSRQVRKELDVADDYEKRIIPVKIEEGINIPASMQLQIAGLQIIEFENNNEKDIKCLIDALEVEYQNETHPPSAISTSGPFILKMTKTQFEKELEKFILGESLPVLNPWRLMKRRRTEMERKRFHPQMDEEYRNWELVSSAEEADTIVLTTSKYRGIVLEIKEKLNGLWVVLYPEGDKESITIYENGLFRHLGYERIEVDQEAFQELSEWFKDKTIKH
jgi:hypothetical protein